jgi:hypothetical protein
MSPEEWLRERGIDITRRPGAVRPGELASQHTHALPSMPGFDDDDDVASQETRLVPTVVRLDLRLGGDVAEWPTAALLNPPAVLAENDDAVVADGAAVAENDDAASFDDDFDYTIEDEMTVPLPIITPDSLTPAPDPASTAPAETVSAEPESAPEEEMDVEAVAATSDISTTPTRRLA